MSNPLIDCDLRSNLPFATMKPSDFLPALEHYRTIANNRLDQIRKNQSAPNFTNTILAIETAAEELGEVSSAYYVLFSAEAVDEIQSIAPDVASFLADFSSDLFLDEVLFERVRFVNESKSGIETKEAERLLEITYRNFKRNGALLSNEKKVELRQIDNELSKLSPLFSQNVLKATNSFQLHIQNQEDLSGLPETVIEQAHERARKDGKDGWIFTLQYPDYMPFMTYQKNRSLREKMYRAFRRRGLEPESDNRPVIYDILRLKSKRAKLLGYETHADYVLEERMAGSRQVVNEFLEDLLLKAKPAAERELGELKEFAAGRGVADLQPWDVRFFSEQLKRERYDFDQESLRVYFPLEQVLEGLFAVVNRLYGLTLKERHDVPVYHSEVRVFEVIDMSDTSDTSDSDASNQESKERYVGLFYMDLFPRETKKSGAWMTAIKEQGLFQGRVERPSVGIVCNFTRPSASKPSLLTLDEVRTLFHEFGHSLHGLLSDVTYRSLAGTNVYWDFVELPSQFMENWTRQRESLDLFARHYETQAKIPAGLLDRLKAAETFQAGIQFLTQLNYGLLDMAFYTTDPEKITDIQQFEREVTKQSTLLEDPDDLSMATGFGHIFGGGYSAGYYSYKWAEVLEADAFELFLETGIFNQEAAYKFREAILQRGNSEHPMDLYVQFRGRKPDTLALLRRDGLVA